MRVKVRRVRGGSPKIVKKNGKKEILTNYFDLNPKREALLALRTLTILMGVVGALVEAP